jgi:hypothetical protein
MPGNIADLVATCEVDHSVRASMLYRGGRRDPQYTCEEFERAAAHEDLWNALQKEFLLRGTIQAYDRMYEENPGVVCSRPESAGS